MTDLLNSPIGSMILEAIMGLILLFLTPHITRAVQAITALLGERRAAAIGARFDAAVRRAIHKAEADGAPDPVLAAVEYLYDTMAETIQKIGAGPAELHKRVQAERGQMALPADPTGLRAAATRNAQQAAFDAIRTEPSET